MKICFTTALFGDPKTLDKPAKFERNPNYDYFMFTDIDDEHFDTSWDVINIKDNPNISSLTSNVRKSRYPKFMSWELLESLGKSYDVVFYCDAFWHPNNDQDFEPTCQTIKNEQKFPFMQADHRKDWIRNGGITCEMENIVAMGRDAEASMKKTRDFFNRYDPSVDLNYPQYWENTMFGYSFYSENIRNITKKFWEIYITEDITYRDQPLWNFLLLKYDFRPMRKRRLRWNFLTRQNRHKALFIVRKENVGSMRENYIKGEN